MEALLALFWSLHLAPVLAVGVYVTAEKSRRGAYHAFDLPPKRVDDGPYRSPRWVDAGHLERAPAVVRAAAFSSIVMGAAFLPGLAWGLLGVFCGGTGLVSIPGLVIAAWLWKAGFGLLVGTRHAARSAMGAARLSFWFNVVLLAGVVLVSTQWQDLAAVLVFTGFYAVVSIAQAALLARAAVTLAALHDGDLALELDAKVPSLLRPVRIATTIES